MIGCGPAVAAMCSCFELYSTGREMFLLGNESLSSLIENIHIVSDYRGTVLAAEQHRHQLMQSCRGRKRYGLLFSIQLKGKLIQAYLPCRATTERSYQR